MKHPNILKLVKLAISSRESVDSAVEAATPLLPNGLDYLVNNAGENPQPTTSFEALYVSIPLYFLYHQLGIFNLSGTWTSWPTKLKRIIFLCSVLASSQIISS
jgi:NAD(P)-dependent dehydrogenase (short-subunit alcohol dehydrogenase family)